MGAVSGSRLAILVAQLPTETASRTCGRCAARPRSSTGQRFPIGGSRVLRRSAGDRVTLIGAGITVDESLEAAEMLGHEGIAARVIDLYSIKPVDESTFGRRRVRPAGS